MCWWSFAYPRGVSPVERVDCQTTKLCVPGIYLTMFKSIITERARACVHVVVEQIPKFIGILLPRSQSSLPTRTPPRRATQTTRVIRIEVHRHARVQDARPLPPPVHLTNSWHCRAPVKCRQSPHRSRFTNNWQTMRRRIWLGADRNNIMYRPSAWPKRAKYERIFISYRLYSNCELSKH